MELETIPGMEDEAGRLREEVFKLKKERNQLTTESKVVLALAVERISLRADLDEMTAFGGMYEGGRRKGII